MYKFWISLCLVLAGTAAVIGQDDDTNYDYWQVDYNDQWYQDELEKLGLNENEASSKSKDESVSDVDTGSSASQNDDYQIEDNRSISEEDKEVLDEPQEILANDEESANEDSIQSEENKLDGVASIVKETKDLLSETDSKLEESGDNDENLEEKLEPETENKSNKAAIKDDVSNNENDEDKNLEQNLETENKSSVIDNDSNDEKVYKTASEELKELFEEANDNDDGDKDSTGNKQSVDASSALSQDTVDKTYEDLNENLDSLIETMQELASDKDSSTADEQQGERNEVLDYEEKYDRPFNEGVVLKQRQNDEESINESLDDYDEAEQDLKEDSEQTADDTRDANENDKIDDSEGSPESVPYGDDAIDAHEEKIASKVKKSEQSVLEDKLEPEEIVTVKPIDYSNLSEADVTELMKKFAVDHADYLDVRNENFDKNVAARNIPLNYAETVTICSPNYPDPYPHNNIVDWILDGDGMGIEVNITEVDINGDRGDYLLLLPGGLDERGRDGLIFSYQLNNERRYRFMDVDRMFVRFESKQESLHTHTGFCFSVKLMGPRPIPPEPTEKPDRLPPHTNHTHTLFFRGINEQVINPQIFQQIRKDFHDIIADMALLYINSNNIPYGTMTTREVTNITQVTYCNVNWRDVDNCVAVTFGVPLKYAEGEENLHRLNSEDLNSMWKDYSGKNPFVGRIDRLDIQEFIPNDRGYLTLWLMVGVVALIFAALMSLAIWRFNCFDNYTRMTESNETDNVKYERKEDQLWPSPYQELPPAEHQEYGYPGNLVTNNDITRVDMGAYANNSYIRDDLFESDDDTPVGSHSRYSNRTSGTVSGIIPADIYQL